MNIKKHNILCKHLLALLLSLCAAVNLSASVFAYDEVFPAGETEAFMYPSDSFELEFIPIADYEAEAVRETGERNYELALSMQLPGRYESSYNASSPYYYNLMNSAERDLYDKIVSSCNTLLNSNADITGSVNGHCYLNYITLSTPLPFETVQKITYAVYFSNPQFFFLENGISYSYNSEKYITYIAPMVIGEYGSGSARLTAKSQIQAITSEWMREINTLGSDLEKENRIAQKLCETITYGRSEYDQTIAGALIYKKCVCNGYTMAMTYFCHEAGINCIGVIGYEHAWNMVQINGVWYETDVTWMDQSTVDGRWFNKSRDTFLTNDSQGNHRIDSAHSGIFALPSTSIDYPECVNHKWGDYVIYVQPHIDGKTIYFGSKYRMCGMCFEKEWKTFCPEQYHSPKADFGKDGVNHWQVCAKCDEMYNITPHNFTDGTCTVCGQAGVSGDINGDGQFTIRDVIFLAKEYRVGNGAQYISIADMNGDGKITILDVIKLCKLYRGN